MPKSYLPTSWLSDKSEDRISHVGIVSVRSWLGSVGLVSAYHALKANYRNGKFSNASDGMTRFALRKHWSLFTEVVMAEAGEVHVKHRAFSLSRFISFLCSGSLPTNSITDFLHARADAEHCSDCSVFMFGVQSIWTFVRSIWTLSRTLFLPSQESSMGSDW